jgi:hypothetical protein
MLTEAILTRTESDQRLIDHFDLYLEPRIHLVTEPDDLLLRTMLLQFRLDVGFPPRRSSSIFAA